MKKPQSPPRFKIDDPNNAEAFRLFVQQDMQAQYPDYPHWDVLRRKELPPGWPDHRSVWIVCKLQRMHQSRRLEEFIDCKGKPFSFLLPDSIQKVMHEVDLFCGGQLGSSSTEFLENEKLRERYIVNSLTDEAIMSSQIEGAVTTRRRAKQMIAMGRAPKTRDERMIVNNYNTMKFIRKNIEKDLSSGFILEIHRHIAMDTLNNPDAVGRFRTDSEDEIICVADGMTGEVFHQPPPSNQLSERMDALCRFANQGPKDGVFLHPLVRAIILHFWLAYIHPFVDGNGRTARAVFYWAMLHYGYWLFELLSISRIIQNAKPDYLRAFLYTETDENDLTYFILNQARATQQAMQHLHKDLSRREKEFMQTKEKLQHIPGLNIRQMELLRHALRKGREVEYTIASHQMLYGISYATARADLLTLSARGFLDMKKRGRAMCFIIPDNLTERISPLGSTTT